MLGDQSQVYQVNDTEVLIETQDKLVETEDKLELIDVVKGSVVKELSAGQKILDVHVLTNPNKIIVLTQTDAGKIQKRVFNDQGAQTGKFQYPIRFSKNAETKLTAPYGHVNERLMVRQGNRFTLYSPAGRQPLVTLDAQIDKGIYE